jgi:hypothetical protein
MADYHSFPLWAEPPDEPRNIDPTELPISDTLCQELLAWSDDFDNTLNLSDPSVAGFPSEQTRIRFITKGRALAEKLRRELGEGVQLIYDDSVLRSD